MGILTVAIRSGVMVFPGWQRQQFSLQTVLVVPFLLQISAAVSLTWALSWHNAQDTVREMAQQLMERTGAQVAEQLDSYLSMPAEINEFNKEAWHQGLIATDTDRTRRSLWAQLIANPRISYIDLTTLNGSYQGVGRLELDERLIYEERRPGPDQSIKTYLFDRGEIGSLEHEGVYEPQSESWYQNALQKQRQTWTLTIEESTDPANPYFIGMTLAKPVYDRANHLLGVVSSDLSLGHISRQLGAIRPSPGSEVLLTDRQGGFIATSTAESVVTLLPRPSQPPRPERLTLAKSKNPLLRQVRQAIATQLNGLNEIDSKQVLTIDYNGQTQYLLIKPWRDAYGLDWIVTIIVPESDFMGQIHANIRQTILLCALALSGATMLGLWTSRWIAGPILQLQRTTQAIAAGELNYAHQALDESTQGSWRIREVGDLSRSLGEMAQQLRESFATLAHLAHHDSLTGLLNRRAFRERLQSHLEQSASRANPADYGVLFLDLDYFKLVNDSLGHLVGDQLLTLVADRLRQLLRSSDILARLGGDEFVILLPATAPDEVSHIAQRLIHSLQKPYHIQGHELFINSSIGIVLGAADADADDLLRSADVALYRAKSAGRGCYELFDHRMYAVAVERLQLETDLRHAIDRGEMRVYYQPIVDTQTQVVLGFEALLRWQHPLRGMVSPMDFIPIAEETGLILPIGDWVLSQSCQQLRTWHQSYPQEGLGPGSETLMISVNVSSKQFLLPDFVARINQLLVEQSIPARCLKLEITETLLMQHEARVLLKLQQLQEIGVQLSIDDFGTGYSSLSYLSRFPIGTLKIDRSFVQQMDEDPKNLMVVEAIVDLSRRMGLNVVAEGVETQSQLRRLQDLNCQMAQGFLLGKPMDARAATSLLAAEAEEESQSESTIALSALFNAVTRG